MGLTTDRNHPDLKRGTDDAPVPQQDTYLVLSAEERSKGFVKPYRDMYRHKTCGSVTTMGRALSETYARDPWFYGGTYCCKCAMHRRLNEFTWEPDGESMDPADWPAAETDRVVKLAGQIAARS